MNLADLMSVYNAYNYGNEGYINGKRSWLVIALIVLIVFGFGYGLNAVGNYGVEEQGGYQVYYPLNYPGNYGGSDGYAPDDGKHNKKHKHHHKKRREDSERVNPASANEGMPYATSPGFPQMTYPMY